MQFGKKFILLYNRYGVMSRGLGNSIFPPMLCCILFRNPDSLIKADNN